MKEKIIQIDINRLGKEGKGSGTFTDGAGNLQTVEVPFTAPGDHVEVQIKRKQKGIYPGRLLKIVKESFERVAPRCLHFGECGGCTLQHIAYPDQLKLKQDLIQKLFKGYDAQILPILGCESPWNYRNKMEYSFSQDREGRKYLGLFIAGRRGKVLNVLECHLPASWVAPELQKVRAWWESTALTAYNPHTNRGSLRTITFREGETTGQRMVMLTVSGNPEDALHKEDLKNFTDLFSQDTSVFLRIHQAIKGKPTQFFEMHLQGPEFIQEKIGLNFDISPTAFFQPNTKQAVKIYETVMQLAELNEQDVVYDLYCGTGTMGLLAAKQARFVLGVELSPESSLDGRENGKKNGVTNFTLITGSVEKVLGEEHTFPKPTVVLVDPPRAGLDQRAIDQLLEIKSPKLIYISCNPTTQARDIELLTKGGYTLKLLQPVDQFPNTPHLENIALLSINIY